MTKHYCAVLLSIVVAAGMVSAVTDDEKKIIAVDSAPIIASCAKQFSITNEEVLASKKEKSVGLNPCFYACVFKKMGIVNDQGLFDLAIAKQLYKKYVHGQDDLDKLDTVAAICSSVNSQTVSDGAKGCERSKLLVQCLLKNKDDFPLLSE